MAKKDELGFSKDESYVQPSVQSTVLRLTIPFPRNVDVLAHPYTVDDSKCHFSPEAFDSQTGELIVFAEDEWASGWQNDLDKHDAFGRLIPENIRPRIADGSFSHELLSFNDFSPESVHDFLQKHGWLFLPYCESQQRFLSFRYHKKDFQEDNPQSYKWTYPDRATMSKPRLFVKAKETDCAAFALDNAAKSIWAEVVRCSGPDPWYCWDTSGYSLPEVADAIVLSEYARRYLLNEKDEWGGGVISYYETITAIRCLQSAMRIVMEFEYVKEDPSIISSGAFEDYFDEGWKYRSVALKEMLDCPQKSDLHKSYDFNNMYEHHLRPAVDYISACAFSHSGASSVRLNRAKADADDFNDGIKLYWTDRVELKNGEYFHFEMIDRMRFLCRNAPLLLEDRFAEGSYSMEVAAQFLDILAMDIPWKRCKNPDCGRLFKLKYSPDKSNTRNRQGDYCCDKCGSDMRNKRNNTEQRVILNAKRRYSRMEPGYETVDAALASIEAQMAGFYEGEDAKRLPKARLRWREKLTSV